MRFTIEIPDELFRTSSPTPQPATQTSMSNEANAAINGGGAPNGADGTAFNAYETLEAFSAGPAVETVGTFARADTADEKHDGGAAPQSGR
jgi:hypothetical protein